MLWQTNKKSTVKSDDQKVSIIILYGIIQGRSQEFVKHRGLRKQSTTGQGRGGFTIIKKKCHAG